MGPAIMNTNGIFFQMFSFFFFCSAIFERDVLIIRFCLLVAYIFIITNASQGFPSWGTVQSTPWLISIDGCFWGLWTILFHIRALSCMLYWQRPITFKNEDERAMQRFLYRRGGAQKWEVRKMLDMGSFVKVKAGTTIPTDKRALYLVIDGVVLINTVANGVVYGERKSLSGSFLDLAMFNVVGVRVGLMKVDLTATAATDCTLFLWSLKSLEAMTSGPNVALMQVWQNLALYAMAANFSYQCYEGPYGMTSSDSNGCPENSSWLQGAKSADFGEWTDQELVRFGPTSTSLVTQAWWYVRDYVMWILTSMQSKPIEGLRHLGPVMSGLGARSELLFAENTYKDGDIPVEKWNTNKGDTKLDIPVKFDEVHSSQMQRSGSSTSDM